MIKMSNRESENKPRKMENAQNTWIIAFQTLPFWELAFVILTSLIFGMFTWGFNPDDKNFRTTYILAILVGLPAGILVGTILKKLFITTHNRVMIIFALISSVIFFIAYLWFFAKIPLPGVTIQYPSEFSGWHWAEHYQLWLYYAIIITLGLRLGLSFSSSPIFRNHNFDNPLINAGILMVSLFGITWLSGDWTTLFLGMAILELGSALSWLSHEPNAVSSLQSMVGVSAHHPFLIKGLLPFMALGIGIQMGLVYIAKIGNFFWIEAYLEIFLLMLGIFILNWSLVRKVTRLSQRRINMLLLFFGFFFLYLALILEFMTPDSIFWIGITGVIIGNFVWILSDFIAPQYALWKKFFHITLLLILFTLGVGGGLAYYWYEASTGFNGKSIILQVMIAITVMNGVFGLFYSKKIKSSN